MGIPPNVELMAKKNTLNFEKSMDELEQLVESMEQGDLTLEESLKSFEKGIQLTRSCQKALQEAEQKIQILLSKDGETTLSPLENDS